MSIVIVQLNYVTNPACWYKNPALMLLFKLDLNGQIRAKLTLNTSETLVGQSRYS